MFIYIYDTYHSMFIYIQVSKGLQSVLHSDIHYMLSARINIVIAVKLDAQMKYRRIKTWPDFNPLDIPALL